MHIVQVPTPQKLSFGFLMQFGYYRNSSSGGTHSLLPVIRANLSPMAWQKCELIYLEVNARGKTVVWPEISTLPLVWNHDSRRALPVELSLLLKVNITYTNWFVEHENRSRPQICGFTFSISYCGQYSNCSLRASYELQL